MSRESVIDRKTRGIRTRHRPEKPATEEGLIEELAGNISAADIAAHVAASDPHTQYQKESEKGLAGGYASLDGAGTVPDAQIPATIARDTEITAAVNTHVAASDPHTQYRLESVAITTSDLGGDITAAGKALLDDAAASNQRTTLGLGDSATRNVGTSAGTAAAGDDSRFVTQRGSGSVVAPNGVATTIADLSSYGEGSFYIAAWLSGGAALDYTADGHWIFTGAGSRTMRVQGAGILSISLSGNNVQVSQSSGSDKTIRYQVTRMA